MFNGEINHEKDVNLSVKLILFFDIKEIYLLCK